MGTGRARFESVALPQRAGVQPPHEPPAHREGPVEPVSHRGSRRPRPLGRSGIEVATKNGVYIIMEVKRSGKRSLKAAEFMRGFPLPVGSRLN